MLGCAVEPILGSWLGGAPVRPHSCYPANPSNWTDTLLLFTSRCGVRRDPNFA